MGDKLERIKKQAETNGDKQREALAQLPTGQEAYLALDPVERMQAAERILLRYARIKPGRTPEGAHPARQALEDDSTVVYRAGAYEDRGTVSYAGMDNSTGTWMVAWANVHHKDGGTSGDVFIGKMNYNQSYFTGGDFYEGFVVRSESVAAYGSSSYRPFDPEKDGELVEAIDAVCVDLLEGRIAEQRQALGRLAAGSV